MKLTRTIQAIMGVGCLLVAAVIIFVMWNNAVDSRDTTKLSLEAARKLYSAVVIQKAALNDQITQIEITIKQGQEQVATLKTDFTQAEKDLQQAKDQYLALAESIEYSEYLLGFARTANLAVLAIESSEANIADFSTKTDLFHSTTFTVNLKGNVLDILAFIDSIVQDDAFKSSNIGSVTFDIPVPLTQTQKDEIKARINTEQLALKKASLTPHALLVYTEQAVMALLGHNNSTLNDPQVMLTETMISRIRDAIGSLVGQDIANMYTPEIADAIEQEEADRLIDIVADIFGQAIGDLFTTGDPELTPIFGGSLGEEITAALKDIPPSLVGGLVTGLIKTHLQTMLDDTLSALVDPLAVEQMAALEISEAEKAFSTITLIVFTYKGS